LLQTVDFFRDIDGGIILHEAQLFDLGFQIGNGLFEVEETGFHGLLVFELARILPQRAILPPLHDHPLGNPLNAGETDI